MTSYPVVMHAEAGPATYSVAEITRFDETDEKFFWCAGLGDDDPVVPVTGWACTFHAAMLSAYEAAKRLRADPEPRYEHYELAREVARSQDPLAHVRELVLKGKRVPLWWAAKWSADGREPVHAAWEQSSDLGVVLLLAGPVAHGDPARLQALALAAADGGAVMLHASGWLSVDYGHEQYNPEACAAVRALLPPPPRLEWLMALGADLGEEINEYMRLSERGGAVMALYYEGRIEEGRAALKELSP